VTASLESLPAVQCTGLGTSLEALRAYLRSVTPEAGVLQRVDRLGGGQSNPTFRLVLSAADLILRRKLAGPPLPSAHAIEREYRVMGALRGSAVPVPTVLHCCSDDSLFGSPFYIVEFVHGRIFWDARLPDCAPGERARIYAAMGDVLAALHAIDPYAVGLGDFGPSGGYFSRQVRRWTDQYRASETHVRDAMDSLIDWLPRNLPPDDGQVTLTHGDYRLDNLVFDAEGRAVALLDWELSTLGHLLADLAYQCAQWRLPTGVMRSLQGVDRRAIGLPTESEYVDRYFGACGIRRTLHWPFYLAVSLFRLAAIWQGVCRRGLDENAAGSAAAGFSRRTDIIAACAVDIVVRESG
jgi:aminoglycoside phosphotransferase (APT) family kinase protein